MFFNYYYLLIGGVILFFCICIMYSGRLQKRKLAMARSQGQSALARDVAGWRGRFPVSVAASRDALGLEEGLDERGEAPPPYVAGGKPPDIHRSLVSERGEVGGIGENPGVGHGRTGLPGYHEADAGARQVAEGDGFEAVPLAGSDIVRRPDAVHSAS